MGLLLVLVKLPSGLFVLLSAEVLSEGGKTPYCEGVCVALVLFVNEGLGDMAVRGVPELEELSVLFDRLLLPCSGNTPYCEGVCVLLVLTPGLFVTFEDIRRSGLSSRGVVGGKTPYCEGELVVLVLFVELPNIGLPLAPIEPDRGVREPAELSLSLRRGETTLGSVGGNTPYCEGV